MMTSLYCSMFNIRSCRFDVRDALQNFCAFADEVVIASLRDADESYQTLRGLASEFPNLRVVLSLAEPFTPDFDGQIKDDALQATTHEIKLGIDADERLVLGERAAWRRMAKLFIIDGCYDAVMLPSIDLYGSLERCKSVGRKWYLHRAGLRRGTVNFARRPDGTHDTTKSDSCELLTPEGNLCSYYDPMARPFKSELEKVEFIEARGLPKVFHLGYLDLGRRADINQKFWAKMWEAEEGKEVRIPLTTEELRAETFEHGLILWNE